MKLVKKSMKTQEKIISLLLADFTILNVTNINVGQEYFQTAV